MSRLARLGLLFLFVSLVKSDAHLELYEPNDVLRTKLENKLNYIKSAENEVTDVKPEPKPAATNKIDYPVAFREEPPCPNFNDVMNDMKTTMTHLTKLVNAAISIFTDTFNNPEYKCKVSLNPLTTLKCLLRVFAVSYKELTSLWVQVSALREDLSKIMTEYHQYSTQCNKNWSFGNTLQLIDLFKVLEGYIKDA